MPFTSGVFTLYTPGNPVVTGTTISSTWANNTLNDIATGLSTALLKDGTQTVTANVPMAGFKMTGLGAATTAGDALSASTSGYTLLPLQPAFSAYANAVITNVTGAGTGYGPVVFNTEVIDQSSSYSVAGVFTAPITGPYTFAAGVYLQGCTVLTTGSLLLTTSNRNWQLAYTVRAASALDMYLHGAVHSVDLDAGDTAYVLVTGTGEAGNTVDVYGTTFPVSYFTGRLSP